MTLIEAATAIAYSVASLLLFIFGVNLVVFVVRVWRNGPVEQKTIDLRDTDDLPTVTVQLPIYNELYVSERVIKAACAMEYPAEKLQIQVLDDSTDETKTLIAHVVAELQAEGVNIVHEHRTDRSGYKAGALAEGMKTATGEFVAIFDADFVPPTDFLLRTIPEFDDPDVAFVQGRWGHLNRDYSWLTRVQALTIDGHFLVEQAGRGLAGYWFNFNGTAGIWRAEAIDDAGGWTAETLTEDLDLSYRAHLKGWVARYLPDLVIPAELPVQLLGFRRQQHRWARGSMECARKLLPSVWRTDATIGTKFQATVHLLAYGIHLLLLLLLLIYPLVVQVGSTNPRFSTLYGVGYVLALTSLAPAIFFIAGQRQGGRSWLREIPRILLVTVFGSGLMLNTARAFLQIFTKPNPEFERTAKFGLSGAPDGGGWVKQRYQLNIDRIVFAEFALGLYGVGVVWFAFTNDNLGILIYAGVFSAGLLFMAIASITHAVASYRGRFDRKAQVMIERQTWTAGEASPSVDETLGESQVG